MMKRITNCSSLKERQGKKYTSKKSNTHHPSLKHKQEKDNKLETVSMINKSVSYDEINVLLCGLFLV